MPTSITDGVISVSTTDCCVLLERASMAIGANTKSAGYLLVWGCAGEKFLPRGFQARDENMQRCRLLQNCLW